MLKRCFLMAVTLSLFLLSGCAGLLPERFGALAQEQEGLHSPVAGEENADIYQAELYFRFLDEPYLAAESRTLIVQKDESFEKALVRALISGPSAASSELRRLFSEDVTVESTVAQDELLFVTLSANVTDPLGDEPARWREDVYWQKEVPLRRQLAMQSLAATLIENCGYESIQILLDKRADANGSMRLPMSYYQVNEAGLAPVLRWDDQYLLTPQKAADVLLKSYQQKDWERVMRYVAVADGAPPPNQTTAGMLMDQWLTLIDYQLGEAVLSQRGSNGIVACGATVARSVGDTQQLQAYPLRLIRENSIWKISWSELEGLLNRW